MILSEYIRQEVIKDLFKSESMQKCWDIWKDEILNRIGKTPNAKYVLDLGDCLSEIFNSTKERKKKDNSAASAGGNAWERLVCYYLNLCLAGSRTVVFKQKKAFIPDPIADAIQVNYGNFPSNTEADLVALTFPKTRNYLCDYDGMDVEGVNLFNKRGKFQYKPVVNELCARDFRQLELSIIQCKTNWNDCAQIPMLWDMVYSAKSFKDNVHVGANNYSIKDLKKFSYCFMTVPTSRGPFKPTSTCVKRVVNLSGGNYWGHKTEPSVACSIKEIFARNFANGAQVDIRNDLREALSDKGVVASFHLSDSESAPLGPLFS